MKDEKEGLAIILGKMAAKKPKEDEADDEYGEEGKEEAAKEILNAMKTNDSAALKSALSAFIDLC